MKPVEKVLGGLRNVQQENGHWKASCPVPGHGQGQGDRNPTLQISEDPEDRVGLKCWAGCSTESVLEALGLVFPDLFPQNGNGKRKKADAIWEIRDSSGTVQAEHHRFNKPDGGKDCFWKLPGARDWGLKGRKLESLPLYGSERVTDADNLAVLAEGEKAARALQEAGILALGTVTGASGTPSEKVLSVVQDMAVVLWPDADNEGRAHMHRAAERLQGIASSIHWYEWPDAPEKGDAADVPNLSGIREQLLAAPEWEPREEDGEPEDGIFLSDVEPEKVEWLWPGRIPLGKISILDGDPGFGKSVITTDLAARISVGREFPDDQPCEAGGVILMNAEDGLADTIRPRLDAAYGDPSKILSLATVQVGEEEGDERLLSIPGDVRLIEHHIQRIGAKLVVIDPLMAFLSGEVSSHKDQDVRRALAPLKRVAERTGAAILLVRHLNKGQGGNALYRGGGSIGIIGAARAGMLVGQHPEEEDLRVLAAQKANLSRPPDSLAYRITEAANGSARIEYRGIVEAGADALLQAPSDPDERSALKEAADFLRDELKGGPVAANSVKQRAKDRDISAATLKRAKHTVGARSEKDGTGGWLWWLPSKGDQGRGSRGSNTKT